MKTILSGPVRQRHIDDAELLAGIEPTLLISNGECGMLKTTLPVEIMSPCPMLPGELGLHQRDFTMCLSADALICVGENEHLVRIARKYGLLIYEVD